MAAVDACELHATGSTSLPLVSIRKDPVDEIDLTPQPTGCCQTFRLAAKEVIEVPGSSTLAVVVQCFIMLLICLSTLSVIIETVPGMEYYRQPITVWENVVTVFFTIEIMIRLWVADSFYTYVASCSNIVDIFATAPGYVEVFLASQRIDPFWRLRTQRVDPVWSMQMLRILQMIRLMRILRIAKAARHSEIVTTVMLSFYASLTGLSALVVFVGSSAVLSATVVFYTEAVDPQTQFTSIPAALWWSLATITGVGYGDMVPLTVAGKAAGAVTMIMGVLAISMSVAIITTAFMEEYRKSLALMKLSRLQKRRSGRVPTLAMERERRGSSDDDQLRSEFSPLSLPGRSSFREEVDETSLLSTLMELEDKSKEVLMQLEATALKVERLSTEDAPLPRRKSFTALTGLTAPSPGGSPVSKTMAGTKTALAFLREQNAVWFRSATQLAEQILESQAEAEGPEEEQA